MMKGLFFKNWHLKAPDFRESAVYDQNPGKGWYRIYSYDLSLPLNHAEMEAVFCPEEELALLRVSIGGYRDRALPPEALERFCGILEFWKAKKKDLILRIVYDCEGRGLEHEPALISLVKRHMEQLGEVIRKYAARILTLQGLFVGSWGEMHGSKFLGDTQMKELYRTLSDCIGGCCFLSVRKPQQWRVLTEYRDIRPGLGLYNDGMLGSESDFGTYREDAGKGKIAGEAWCRQEELEFQDEICRGVPNGGEVIGSHPLSDIPQAVKELKRMHVTYLNSQYDPLVLNKWKKNIWHKSATTHENELNKCTKEGECITAYDYIGMHLGYRFVVRSVSIEKKEKGAVRPKPDADAILVISVENTGFAPLYQRAEAYLVLKDESGGQREVYLDTNPLQWSPGECVQLQAPLKLSREHTYEISICLRRTEDGCVIRFANEPLEDRLFLGSLTDHKRP